MCASCEQAKQMPLSLMSALRPYALESTGSRPISKVKLVTAQSVLRSVTTWEYQVLYCIFTFCYIFYSFWLQLLLSLAQHIQSSISYHSCQLTNKIIDSLLFLFVIFISFYTYFTLLGWKLRHIVKFVKCLLMFPNAHCTFLATFYNKITLSIWFWKLRRKLRRARRQQIAIKNA